MALFFSQRKPKGFNYSPRYYDPEAEAREERKKIVLGEKYKAPGETGADRENYVPGTLLREHVAARRGANAAKNMHKRRRKVTRPIVLVGILIVIALIIMRLFG